MPRNWAGRQNGWVPDPHLTPEGDARWRGLTQAHHGEDKTLRRYLSQVINTQGRALPREVGMGLVMDSQSLGASITRNLPHLLLEPKAELKYQVGLEQLLQAGVEALILLQMVKTEIDLVKNGTDGSISCFPEAVVSVCCACLRRMPRSRALGATQGRRNTVTIVPPATAGRKMDSLDILIISRIWVSCLFLLLKNQASMNICVLHSDVLMHWIYYTEYIESIIENVYL